VPDIVVPSLFDRAKEIASERRGAVAVAVLVVVAAAFSAAFFALNRPAVVAPPSKSPAYPAAAPPSGTPAAPLTSATNAGEILVHVDGAVRKPGLFALPMGARVADAIEVAGGPIRAADLRVLNLAQPLADGEKLEVPKKGDQPVASAPSPAATAVPGSSASPSTVVSLNTADQAALESLPEVGPVTAAAILEYRDEAGGFSSVDELLEVSGIGPATLEAMRPFVTV
jgi:competence protein ComEA